MTSVDLHKREDEICRNRQVNRILDSLGLRTLQLRHLSMKLGRTYAEQRLSDRERLVSAYEERDASLAVPLTCAMVLRSLKILEQSGWSGFQTINDDALSPDRVAVLPKSA